MNRLTFEDLPKAALDILARLERLESLVLEMKENNTPESPDQLLTREETATYLKIHISTLWHWSKKGILPSYGIGNRVYYKKSEVEEALVKLTPRY